MSEALLVKAVEDDDRGAEDADKHENAVDTKIDEKFRCEHAILKLFSPLVAMR